MKILVSFVGVFRKGNTLRHMSSDKIFFLGEPNEPYGAQLYRALSAFLELGIKDGYEPVTVSHALLLISN